MIIERAKFNKRSQLPDKPVEQFIASLYYLAADCNFGELKGELIRNRIVVGIRDASLSERLQIAGSGADVGKSQNSRPIKRSSS